MDTALVFDEFKAQITLRMGENIPRVEKCRAELTEEEVWQTPNGNLNSVANLILHLCGNTTQYILSSIGGEEDKRTRDEEFAAKGGYTKAELGQKLTNTVIKAIE
eukprot:gene880-1184_t